MSSTDQLYHRAAKLGREALAYCQCASALISGNKALFVSVDLIGGKNQVILELAIMNFLLVILYLISKNKYATNVEDQTRLLTCCKYRES